MMSRGVCGMRVVDEEARWRAVDALCAMCKWNVCRLEDGDGLLSYSSLSVFRIIVYLRTVLYTSCLLS